MSHLWSKEEEIKSKYIEVDDGDTDDHYILEPEIKYHIFAEVDASR